MNPGSIPAATRPTNLTSTPDSLCLRQLIYLISPIKLRARTQPSARARMCCTYIVARPCISSAHEHARSVAHGPQCETYSGEDRREVNSLTAIGSSRCWPNCRPRIDQFPGCALTLYCTHTVYCRVTKDERYFSTGYILKVCRVPSVLFACYARFVYVSTYFATRRILFQLYPSISV